MRTTKAQWRKNGSLTHIVIFLHNAPHRVSRYSYSSSTSPVCICTLAKRKRQQEGEKKGTIRINGDWSIHFDDSNCFLTRFWTVLTKLGEKKKTPVNVTFLPFCSTVKLNSLCTNQHQGRQRCNSSHLRLKTMIVSLLKKQHRCRHVLTELIRCFYKSNIRLVYDKKHRL